MKKIATLLILFICSYPSSFSQGNQFATPYTCIKSSSLQQDKLFYLLTLFQHIPEINKDLQKSSTLSRIVKQRIAALNTTVYDCKDSLPCYAGYFLWTAEEVTDIQHALSLLYQTHEGIKQLVSKHLRPSGYYQNYASLNDEELLHKAWQDVATSMNYIINSYLLNKGERYPAIDGVSYPINSSYYKSLINEMIYQIKHNSSSIKLFFEPSLAVCLQLLNVNERDEATRYEPLSGRNKKAYGQVTKTNFNNYPYSAILVLGEGPEDEKPISANNKYRCQTAANRYKSKQAPFIIVSGGHVHPFQTLYCEAIEMKKYLMLHFNVPEQAIIIEPYARHTTTNFRNAGRIIIRNHIPFTKKILCVTNKYHTDYINNPEFEQRCIKELGYAPFKSLKRLNDFDTEYLPVLEALQIDPLDPLDP